MDMSRARRLRPEGGRPRRRSKTRKRAEVPIIRNATDESLRGEACVLSWWQGAASLGDQEGRVHGGRPSSVISPISTQTDGDVPRKLITTGPCVSPLEQVPDDSCFPGEWLAALSLGDEQGRGRLHGGSAISPFFTGSAAPSLSSDQPPCSNHKISMSALAMEFCNLKIWRLDMLSDHLGISPESIWESVSRSCSGSSSSNSAASWSSSSGSFTGTSGSSNEVSFNAYLSALSEDMSVRSDKKALSCMDFIDRKLLSILNDIAGIMIEGGCEMMLRRAIDRQSPQLASYIEILDINTILCGHKDESKEILLKVWTTAMHIIVGFLREMQRQLNGQDLGYFNRLKEDYFLAIAKQSVMKLLKASGSICIQNAPIDPVYKDVYSTLKPDLSKMINVVMIYQALNYGMPTILALFSGQTKEFILAQGEGLSQKLSDMFVKLAVEQNDLVRSQCLDIFDTGVHRSTRHIMDQMRMLVQHKSTIYLILKGDKKAFSELVVQLISSLEFMLYINSKGLQLPGQQQMFLLNNVHFVLQEAKRENDLGLILGEGWLLQRHDQLNLLITEYVDASWTPVMSCFLRRTRVPEILWPCQLFDKFTSSLEMTYRVQKTWKVTDPLIRHKVREAIFQKVIPEYRMHVENYLEKKLKAERYSIEQLESQLQELFEG
ncbi:unnamed protein product [Urochloa humidicola]